MIFFKNANYGNLGFDFDWIKDVRREICKFVVSWLLNSQLQYVFSQVLCFYICMKLSHAWEDA